MRRIGPSGGTFVRRPGSSKDCSAKEKEKEKKKKKKKKKKKGCGSSLGTSNN